MEAMLLPVAWEIDQVLDQIALSGFAIIDQAYSHEYQQELILECTENLDQFRKAAIQNGVVSNIRSDHILWINQDQFPVAQQHIQALEQLSQQFNRHFFLGIQHVEAHFACYNSGEFYALHRDNPQQKNDRMISSVYYLHDQWQENWGGQLHLQDKQGEWHIIQPTANRIAIFQSDLLHEVKPAQQQRLSITAWWRSSASLY